MSVTLPEREVPVEVDIIVEAESPEFLPSYSTLGSACMDIRAAESVGIEGGQTVCISAGFRCRVPEGYEMQIRSRSGRALDGLVVANSPGTIDSDYRGTVKVLIHNNTDAYMSIQRGARIAQASIHQTIRVRCLPGTVPNDTQRGTGGFGSTGSD